MHPMPFATLLAEHQHASGALPASPGFSAYAGFSWFRDGAFIADAASAVGLVDEASRFHDWCARVIDGSQERIAAIVEAQRAGTPLGDEAMLPTRFRLDGTASDDGWWDFQTDGYGTWLWALDAHVRRHGLDRAPSIAAVRATVAYLVATWSRPCFDWWEEHAEQRHVSTLGCVGAGLEAAVAGEWLDPAQRDEASSAAARIRDLVLREGVVDGHLVKWLGSDAVDASLVALVAPLGWVDPTSSLARATVDAVVERLEVDGGVHRFAADVFYGGGRWPLLSCFVGLALLALGDRAGAERMLAWARSTATAEGWLPEQVDGHLLAPAHRAEWVERWGEVATPLLWSHAMVARLEVELAESRRTTGVGA